MKRISYLLSLSTILLAAGCSVFIYPKYQRFSDEFKESDKRIARITLNPEERRTEINSATVIFEREIAAGSDITKAYIVVDRSTESFSVESSGYMKAGDQTFEINVVNPVTEYKSRNQTSTSAYAKSDSTGVVTSLTTEADEHNWIDYKFTFALSPGMITQIKETDEFIVRFYFGPVPATFKFRGSKLKPIQKVLQ